MGVGTKDQLPVCPRECQSEFLERERLMLRSGGRGGKDAIRLICALIAGRDVGRKKDVRDTKHDDLWGMFLWGETCG